MNVKTIALAAAAAAFATSASAADLPMTAEPVNYVKACDAFGAGFFQLPGKETCVKIGGRIRVNYQSHDLNVDLGKVTETGTEALVFDGTKVITAKAQGVLVTAENDKITAANEAIALLVATDPDYADDLEDQEDIIDASNGAIETIGDYRVVVAKKADKANDYSAYAKGYLYLTSMTSTEIGTIKTFTEYVAKWDGAGDQTSEIGDAWVQIGTSYGSFLAGREGSIFDAFTGYTSGGPASLNFSDASALQVSFTGDLGNGVTAALAVQDSDYRGGEANELDFVGALKISQGWGSFKLAGVAHSKKDNGDDYGYAAGATAVFNLGMIKEGTEITFQAQYVNDAGSYVNLDSDEVKAYAFSGGLTHNLTDTLTAAIDASYLDVDTANDYNKTAVNGSLAYSPVAGLALSVAAGWEKEDAKDMDKDDVAKVAARVQYTF
ncbi:porin [Pseudovibrio sp. Tun.PSC04-5.I4]|uniref:porin n=1 Tax=Pseudovibrio sp. Tun.PSC04-5.I4 TaxID=1798213 RepID=UPI000C7BDBAE|nr:porin [Pseudovibrio sp. Tun.PSC04-5.I4]